MSLLDEMRRNNEELKRTQTESPHPEEDFIINTVIDLLAERIRKGQYRLSDTYSDGRDYYAISAFLAKVTYKNGNSDYELLDDYSGSWQAGRYSIANRNDIRSVETHPFKKFDYEYVEAKLFAAVKEKIGPDACGVNCHEQFRVEQRLFRKFNDIVHLGKHGVSVGIGFFL